jgi:hypothetical protein
MAFSDGFAKGYAIGDAAKKSRAASKYFKRFKELTDEGETEAVTEIGGVPVPNSALPPSEGDAELPVAPLAETAVPEKDAPVLSPDAAIPEVAVTAPEAIPLKQARKTHKSLTQSNIKELDRLAMDAARAAGDIEVYTALQKTTDSFLQGKVMKNIGLAQAAAQNEDTDAVEKHLTAAYRFIPDGQEIKFKRKDGKLMINDPWDDKEIELNSEMIGNIGTMLRDPEKWADIVRQERKDRARAATDKQLADAKVDENKIDRERLSMQKDQFTQTLGLQKEDLKLKGRATALAEANGRIGRYTEYQQGLYYSALAEQAKALAKTGGKSPGDLLTEVNALGKTIEDSMNALSSPAKDDLGRPDPTWKPSREIMVKGQDGQPRQLAPDEMNMAKGFAQSIAVANMGGVGHNLAQSAALQLVKAQVDPSNFNAQIDAKTGVMLVPFRGMNVPVQLPAALVQSLAEQQAASQQRPAQGSPLLSPQQFLQE